MSQAPLPRPPSSRSKNNGHTTQFPTADQITEIHRIFALKAEVASNDQERIGQALHAAHELWPEMSLSAIHDKLLELPDA